MPAESRPLLELLIRANAAAQNPGEEHEDLAEQFMQVMADPATGEQLRALRAQAEAGAGEIEALREEHEALRLAQNGSHPQLRRLRGRIEELVSELEAHQLSAMRVASVRERVEEARRWAAAALAQADAGGEGCKRCDGIGMVSSARDAEGLWIPETCPECRGRGSTRALAQADAGGEA